MTSGVIFPAFGPEIAWSVITGDWSTDLPLANVTDIVQPSRVARGSAPGARSIMGNFGARPISSIALVNHNLESGSIRVRVYSGANATGSVLHDSTDLVWPGGSEPVDGYRWIRPFIFGVLTGASMVIDMPATTAPTEIGAIEAGLAWDWKGVPLGREIGSANSEGSVSLAGGASTQASENPARTVGLQVDLMSTMQTQTIGLDFQRATDLQRPFVYAESFEDPLTWARRCLLVRNQQLPAIVGRLYRHDAFPVRMVEHLR